MAKVPMLAVGAIALAGAVFGIWLGTRDSDVSTPATTTGGNTAAPSASSGGGGAAPSLPGRQGTTTVTETGRIDPSAGNDGVTYKVDTVTVTDHRSGAGASPPMEVPPNMHPPVGGRKIQPSLTGAFSSQLVRAIADCGKSIPAGARGDHPRVDGEIVIDIHGGRAAVSRSVIQLRDVKDGVDAAKQCIEQKASSLTADAAGEDDLEGYAITVSFPILGG